MALGELDGGGGVVDLVGLGGDVQPPFASNSHSMP